MSMCSFDLYFFSLHDNKEKNKKRKKKKEKMFTLPFLQQGNGNGNDDDNNRWKPVKYLEKPPFKSNWEYRRFMQHNGPEIMKTNALGCMNNNPYATSLSSANESFTLEPKLFPSLYTPSAQPASDLKQQYMTSLQRKARMVAPSISTSNFPSQRVLGPQANRRTQA